MTVANMTFMVDRLGKDCAPLQFVRELTQNAIAAIGPTPQGRGEVIWDVDWNRYTLTGVYKLAVIDTGIGMTGEEMVEYINRLSSSMHEQSATRNFGIGAKIAAAPLNPAGLIYLSWKNGVGHMVHLWRDPVTDQYGLRQIPRPDGTFAHWAFLTDDIKPDTIKDHGTMVVLLGNEEDADTMVPPADVPMRAKWLLRYLNSRYFKFPDGVRLHAREGWQLQRGDQHNFLRVVEGQGPWLDKVSESHGTVQLGDARIHWWIAKESADVNAGHNPPPGHVAALYQDELYELTTGRSGTARLQSFGVLFGHNRVVIYVEPDCKARSVVPNTARTNLLLDGEPLPWADWAAEFREKMPAELVALIEEIGSKVSSDHRQSIHERLKQIRDLFRISRYRPVPRGKELIDESALVLGGEPADSGASRSSTGEGRGGGRGGRAGDIYGLFLAARGIPGEELVIEQDPKVDWISILDGTRAAGDLEDRAARYIPQQNRLQINADFRVFTDMVKRWLDQYSQTPAAAGVVEGVVREWFEQQLIEAILGSLAMKNSRLWTIEDLDRLWSEEALTAVVMPRYHVDQSIRRTLGQRLGSLKERIA